ncbi:MAG: glycoside hydrolase family 32 protein [Actinomycetota bacterium]
MPLRPAVHVSPPAGWLNDPNGLVRHEGIWHAFYQHVPDADVPGPMHWGHATSTDLVTWTDRPVALRPSALGAVFSGSIVVDHDGLAGFGERALVAIHTHHRSDRECQSVAGSTDGGLTWTGHWANPVLTSDLPDFRDPKVWRDDRPELAEAPWVMALAAGRDVLFFRSRDLLDWQPTGRWAVPPELPGIVECPDVIQLTGAGGTSSDALIVSVNDGDGGACHAALGTFDGLSFVDAGRPVRLDIGPDFYAPQSFHSAPGAPVVMAWVGNWRTAALQPSDGWRGVLSFPRRLGLGDRAGSPTITQRFAVEPWSGAPRIEAATVRSAPAVAFHATLGSSAGLDIDGAVGPALQVTRRGEELSIRWDDPVEGEQHRQVRLDASIVEALVDHGVVELLGGGGPSMSVRWFGGREWSIATSGDVELRAVGGGGRAVRRGPGTGASGAGQPVNAPTRSA